MTDWFAQVTGVAGALSGNDMAMPGDGGIPLLGFTYWASELSKSVINGSVPIDRLNDMATRIVATWYQLGQDKDYPPPNFSANTRDTNGPCHPAALISPTCRVNEHVDVQADHKTVAREVATEAITLLKNDGNVLPMRTTASLHVFGSSAQVNPSGPNACEDRSCNVGVLGMGWGTGSFCTLDKLDTTDHFRYGGLSISRCAH
jgi:beta-glucosidase-like glycosyl hydrolase